MIRCFILLLVGIATAHGARADDPPTSATQRARTMDLDLLDDLGAPPTSQTTESKGGGAEAGEDVSAQSPLANIGELMRTVELRLQRDDTSGETQTVQSRIVDELDRLLEMASQSPQPSPGQAKPAGQAPGDSAGQGGDQAARDGVAASDSAGADRAETERLLADFWGDLPQRLREQLQASAAIEFLPKYQPLIEQYYRRLMESRAGDQHP